MKLKYEFLKFLVKVYHESAKPRTRTRTNKGFESQYVASNGSS